jgi:hypothetical protein
MSLSHPLESQSTISRFVEWWSNTRERWARLSELRDLPQGELDRVACDMGVSTNDLLEVASHPEGTMGLLERRLAALDLTEEEIRELSPMLLRDLQRTCTTCSDRQRCIDDMQEDPLAPGWESYCPNSGTLRTLI